MKLSQYIPKLLAIAYRERMKVQKITLTRGLHIELYVDDTNRIHLLLSRPDCYPSELEWKAVLLAMPKVYGPPPEPEYKRALRNMALVGIINTQRPDPFNQLEITSNIQERTQP
jgi:hypothetical protein